MRQSERNILRRYSLDHCACPNCGSTNGVWQTTMGVIGVLFSDYKDVVNRANCDNCKWVGRVHDLIPDPTHLQMVSQEWEV